MTYTLPDLDYDYGALEPHISAQIMQLHHDKHHAAYVAGANTALEKLAAARESGDFGAINKLEKDLAFHLGGHINHSVFWKNMAPEGGGRPDGEIAAVAPRRRRGPWLKCPRGAVDTQRHAKSADAFDDDEVGLLPGHGTGGGDAGEVDADAGLGGGQVGSDGRREAVGVDDFRRQLDVAGGADALDVLVAAGGVGAGRHRLDPGHGQAKLAGAEQQGAGDEGLADLGIGAGQEVGVAHVRAWRVMTS